MSELYKCKEGRGRAHHEEKGANNINVQVDEVGVDRDRE